MRPAVRVGTVLDDPSGGKETTAPAGAAAGAAPAAGAATTLNVPVIPISPHAARTCGS